MTWDEYVDRFWERTRAFRLTDHEVEQEEVGFRVEPRYGGVVQVTMIYPRQRLVRAVEVDLEAVRATDSVRVTYDFPRNGWSILQAGRFCWEEVGDTDSDWQEVAFVPSWGREERCPDCDESLVFPSRTCPHCERFFPEIVPVPQKPVVVAMVRDECFAIPPNEHEFDVALSKVEQALAAQLAAARRLTWDDFKALADGWF